MSQDDDLYVLRAGDADDEWARPQPIDAAVTGAVTDATDLDADDLADVDDYVDLADVAAVLEGDGTDDAVTFTVEGHEVTIDGGGLVSVDE